MGKKDFFKFEIIYESKKSQARVGRIYTPHGIIDTPNFVAVGTNGVLKALDPVFVDAMGLQLMFCNTYHLLLQPGVELIRNAGGLHQFINRKNPIITDSGGFQVFSLAYGSVKDELKSRGRKKKDNLVLKIDEEGVLFRSYRDGRKILLTPESSTKIQKDLGADIIIPLDELLPYHVNKEVLIQSFNRTHRWEKRSLDEHLKNRKNQAMYAVIHGGVDKDLRIKSCKYLASLDFDGFAIGGSLGKTKEEMFHVLKYTLPNLPKEKPNHLLGIGDLFSIEKAVLYGIDTFDSSYPTRCARHGLLLTFSGGIRISSSSNKDKFEPIDKNCGCYTCKNYAISYLQHLFKAGELSFYTLASLHNLHFIIELMKEYRNRIFDGKV